MNFTKNLTVKKSYQYDEKKLLWSFKLAEFGKKGLVTRDYNYDGCESFENLKENVKYSLSDFHFKMVKVYDATTGPSVDYADQSDYIDELNGECDKYYKDHPLYWTEFDIVDKNEKIMNCISETVHGSYNGVFGTIYDKNTGKVICKINDVGEYLSEIDWVDENIFVNYIEHGNLKYIDDGESCWPHSNRSYSKNIHLSQYSAVLFKTYNELEQIINIAINQNNYLSDIDKINWTAGFIDQYTKKYNFPFVLLGIVAEYIPMDPPYW